MIGRAPPDIQEQWIQAISSGEYECSKCPWLQDIPNAHRRHEPAYCENCQAMRTFHRRDTKDLR